jgi:hypothetical protein
MQWTKVALARRWRCFACEANSFSLDDVPAEAFRPGVSCNSP